jgi:hypothetical protein
LFDRKRTDPSAAGGRIAALTEGLGMLLVDIRCVGEARVYPPLIECAHVAVPGQLVLRESRRGKDGTDCDDRRDAGETNSFRHVRSPGWNAHKNPSPHSNRSAAK